MKQSGYTIIELLIALFIVGVSLTVYQVSLNTATLNKQAKYEDIGLRIASSKIEELRATAYASLPSSGSFSHTLLSTLPSGAGTIAVSDYNAETKEIMVAVTWQLGSRTKTVSLQTLITEIGGL
jgi:prepilin-type N-terminal cleavage/methylation domain-containing protein